MSQIDRRTLLASAGAIALGGCASTLPGATGRAVSTGARSGGIHAAAAAKGMRFGSAVSAAPPGVRRGSFSNPDYARLLKADCGLLVPENELKWQATRPGPDQFAFARVDAILAYAERHGMAMRGHTLLWHRPKWFPQWLNDYDYGARPASEAERLLTTHIRTVMRRYKGRIGSYDVVNETIDTDTGGLMETSLSKAMGSREAPLDLAFRTAREEGPDTELVYNDYMSWEPGQEKHRAGVLRLLEGFRKRGVPVDALGIQSHIENYALDPATGLGKHQEREWRAFLDEVTGMGYRLLITEFDVKDNAYPADFAVRDAKVAAYAKAYLDLMLSYRQLRDVLAWGLVDSYSWLQGFSPREDKLPLRCCPYDAQFRPKPMRDALIAAFNGASAR